MSAAARMADRWRSVTFGVTLLAVVFVGAALFTMFQYDGVYRAQKTAEAQVQADILAAGVSAALDFGDSAAAQEQVNALRVNRQLLAAGVYDGNGRLFAGFERGEAKLAASLNGRGISAENAIVVTSPVERTGTRVGSAVLTMAGDAVSRRAARYKVVAALVALAALVVTVLAVAQNVLRRANRRLADANADLRVQIDERTKAEDALRQAQKMQALGQLTGGIAHDFNNLLTVIGGSADLLKRPDVAEPKRIRFASAIAQAAERAAALTSQLLAFARRQPLRPQVLDLNGRILGMRDMLERSLGAPVELRFDLAEDLCAVEVDPTQLEVAILNIAVNARDAMPGGGTITLHTRAARLETGKAALELSVSDTGEGIPADVAERVFEPFFTTKSVGKGTGLGLSQVYGFIVQSGGDVHIDSTPGAGTSVVMRLPCTDRPMPPESNVATAPAARRASILVVEDNEEVGTFAESLLGELGHDVRRARSASEALQLLRQNPAPDLVFSDIVMPGMTGIELADELAILHPGLPVILTSGYSDRLAQGDHGDRPVLSKPYRLDALADAIGRALG